MMFIIMIIEVCHIIVDMIIEYHQD